MSLPRPGAFGLPLAIPVAASAHPSRRLRSASRLRGPPDACGSPAAGAPPGQRPSPCLSGLRPATGYGDGAAHAWLPLPVSTRRPAPASRTQARADGNGDGALSRLAPGSRSPWSQSPHHSPAPVLHVLLLVRTSGQLQGSETRSTSIVADMLRLEEGIAS